MKHLLLAIALLVSAVNVAQSPDLDNLAEAEMKAAYSIANFTANQNTGNYDVTAHVLNFTVNPAQQYISGSVTTTFVALESMTTLTFDMSNTLTASSVTINGSNAPFTQNSNDELVITLPITLNQGATATCVVNYSGAPFDEEDSFVASQHNGVPVLWTLSEPYGAKEWWPCKQDLNDKIESLDVYITAPSQYVSVANGVQQSVQQNAGGTKTTHFQHSYPIPAYLVAIAVTNYTLYNQQAGTAPNNFPIVNYLYPESVAQTESQLAVTPGIMDFFEQTFETYPFHTEKYGHAQCGFGGGMEHTTVSFMGSFGRELISHELAHQWFGDKITCGSWQDIWLNEGFATYLSGLVVEHLDGAESFTNWKAGRVGSITAETGGSVYVPVNDTLNVGRVFSSRLSYSKGAMVLHMLRYRLGNDVFYQAVRNYLSDNDLAFKYAKTDDLMAHLEEQSGLDLDEFFNDWVYGEGYPSYNLQLQYVNQQLKVTVIQSQSHPSVSYFEGRVPIRFISQTGEVFDTYVDNTFNGQQFVVDVPFMVTQAQVNATYDIISADDTTTLNATNPGLLHQIKLYPNPATDVLKLDVPNGVAVNEITIYNTVGQKVASVKTSTQIAVNALQAGEYFVAIDTRTGTVNLKFIKQ